MTLDCLHDMPRPDVYAAAIRRAIKPDGVWFIIDVDGEGSMEENLHNPMAGLSRKTQQIHEWRPIYAASGPTTSQAQMPDSSGGPTITRSAAAVLRQ